MLEQTVDEGCDEVGRAAELMVMRVVSRELATTLDMPAYAAEVARREQQSEFELSFVLWQAAVGSGGSLSATQEMPAYLQDELLLFVAEVRS